jgi:hypothetical protein
MSAADPWSALRFAVFGNDTTDLRCGRGALDTGTKTSVATVLAGSSVGFRIDNDVRLPYILCNIHS